MKQITFSWPEGKAGALTTSWDDGTIYDRDLVAILNKYGLKGSWNLNANKFGSTASKNGWKDYIKESEVVELYKGHEIASHTFNHPHLPRIPEAAILAEIVADRTKLESICKYPVRGFALPFGTYDSRVNQVLKQCGIVYSRTTVSTEWFKVPDDFIEWHATCHHKNPKLSELWERFLSCTSNDKLFYLWGHSYEFDQDDNWDLIENFARTAAEADDVWHATNMEIYDYVKAWRELACAVDMTSVRNTSATTLWLKRDGELQSIAPGATVCWQ